MAKLTEAQKLKLQEPCITVESNLDETIIFGIRRDGRGMHIFFGNEETPIHADSIPILKEAIEVWELHGEGKHYG